MSRSVSSSSTAMGLTICCITAPVAHDAAPFRSEGRARAGEWHRILAVLQVPHVQVLPDAAVGAVTPRVKTISLLLGAQRMWLTRPVTPVLAMTLLPDRAAAARCCCRPRGGDAQRAVRRPQDRLRPISVTSPLAGSMR